MADPHEQLRRTTSISLEAAKRAEQSKRIDLLDKQNPLFQALLTRSPAFAESLPSISLDWQIMLRSYGVSFLKDYPYNTPLYGLIGWDACRLIVDLDMDHNAVALRFHAYDKTGDMTVEEGMLVADGKVTILNEGRFDIPWNPYRNMVMAAIDKATGRTDDPETLRCLFDYFSEDIGALPGVRDSCGSSFGQFATHAYFGIRSGETTMNPPLAVGWPMTEGHYLLSHP